VGFHFIQSLIKRAATQSGAVRQQLDARIVAELENLSRRLADNGLAKPQAPDTMTQLAQRPSLVTLTKQLNHPSPQPAPSAYTANHSRATTVPELKAIERFRSTWSALHTEKQLTRAFDQAPDNAGPLNSHHLVLRSLDVMRDLSPHYLTRFMSHIDALLCLEAAEIAGAAPAKKVGRTRPSQRKVAKK
jgi:hypothetical protein